MKPGVLNPSQLISLILAECRGAWRRLIFFIVCLAIGVGAVMTINSFSQILQQTIQREAKSLLAADLEIRGSWEQNDEDLAFQNKALPSGTEFIFVKELKSMIRYPDTGNNAGKQASLLVELKAVPISPPHFPFYGTIKTVPETPLSELLVDNGAMVEPSFLVRTQLRVGDTVKLGDAVVRIRGEILAEPDRVSRSFSLGPRMMISTAALNQAGLIRPGSRVNHRTLIRLPENANLEHAVKTLEDGLTDTTSTIRTYKQMQSSLTTSITRISKYLGSVGVIALLMGGIGVAMIIRTFMAQKMDTIAIMNCLGASSRTIFKIYLLQSFILGLVGSGLGVLLGFAVQQMLPSRLGGLLSFDVQPEFQWVTAMQSLSLGLFTTFLFSLWPLLRAIKTRPLRLFRRISGEEELDRGSRRERWTMAALFAGGLILIVFWQAGSLRRATVFLVALGVSIIMLSGATALVLRLIRVFPRSRQMTRRYGLANLYRPNNQAASIITALGMGIMLILTVRLVQMDMIGMLKDNSEIDPPNYFFIDIQSDQKDKFAEAIKKIAPEAKMSLTPLIRSKLYSVDDRKVEHWKFESPRRERFVRRDFVLTYMDGPLPQDNEIAQGKWWSKEEAAQPQVSIEEDAARRLGVTLGSNITMDIQGVKITAPVTSIRKVDWRNMRTNFYMIFTLAALEGAPGTYVSTVHVPADKEIETQNAVVQALPNVTAISTRDIIQTVQNVIDKLLTLVDFMSAFTISAGLFILAGAVASTKYRRMKESAILKTLGASRRAVASILGYEYASLGIIAGVVGVGLSLALSWGVMEYIVEAKWNFRPTPLGWTLLLGVLLTTVTGILSSLDVLKNKPFQTLRQID